VKNLAVVCLLTLELVAAGAACGRSSLDAAGSGGTTGAGFPPMGVLPPSPGVFLCGLERCSTSSQQCCLGITTAGGLGASCGRLGSACTGAALQCDEPADCRVSSSASTVSSVCCFGLDSPATAPVSGGVGIGSRCETAASCVGLGRFILCRTDADCGPKGGVCCASVGIPTCQPRCPGA